MIAPLATLFKSGTKSEIALSGLRSSPFDLSKFGLGGRPDALSQRASEAIAGDLQHWPEQGDFVSFLTDETTKGRQIVLLSTGNQALDDAVKTRFDFLVGCPMLALGRSDRSRNLSAILTRRFPNGFEYAGRTRRDLDIWRRARKCYVVGGTGSLARSLGASGKPVVQIAPSTMGPTVLRRSLRLHQWMKNCLVFAPLILAGKWADPKTWIAAVTGFLAVGLAASATYIINDLVDLQNDRMHWSKKARPLAAGDLSIGLGLVLVVLGLSAAAALVWSMGASPVLVLSSYVLLSLAYSFWLKRIAILDIVVLACLFTVRLFLGAAVTNDTLSRWLMVFSMFVFASLSMAKRHTEVLRMIEKGQRRIQGRGYIADDAPLTLGIGLAATLGSVLILIIYLIDDAFPQRLYPSPGFLWIWPLVIFLFLARIWLLAQRGLMRDDPVAFAVKDRICLALGGLLGLGFVGAVVDQNKLLASGGSWLTQIFNP